MKITNEVAQMLSAVLRVDVHAMVFKDNRRKPALIGLGSQYMGWLRISPTAIVLYDNETATAADIEASKALVTEWRYRANNGQQPYATLMQILEN